jgi:PAS domain S-box-containing protein
MEAARHHYELMARHSRDPILCLRPGDGRILEANAAAVSTYGYSHDELLALSLPDLRAPETTNASDAQMGMAEGGSILFETLHRRKDGTIFPVEVNSQRAARGDGGVLVSVIRDISERKRAEDTSRNFARAVEQSPASIVITDTEGSIQYVNKKFEEVTGYSRDEAIGCNPRILKSDYTGSEGYRQLWESISSGREWRGEFLNRRKDGALYWEMASISPVKNAAGKITHYLAVKEDITARKRADS